MTEKLRITFKHKRPNPLFEECLELLHKNAQMNNSKIEPMLREALTSLSKYPLPLKTGAECAILKGFNVKLCKYLDKFLLEYNASGNENEEQSFSHEVQNYPKKVKKNRTQNKENGHHFERKLEDTSKSKNESPVPQTSQNNGLEINNKEVQTNTNPEIDLVGSSRSESNSQSSVSPKKKSKERIYRPAYKSGAYAILLALLERMQECPDDPALTKEHIIDRAQKHSEESFVRPKPDSFYTAWSNITRLVAKGLVAKTRKKKVFYSLTVPGVLLATELLKDSANKPTVNDIIFNNITPTVGSVSSNQEARSMTSEAVTESVASQFVASLSSHDSLISVLMPSGSFEVILLIDKNETGGVSKKNDPTVAQFNKYPDLKHEYRSLKVGDFTWIARHKVNKDQELVLPYVVERKRMDDLGSSIKDGRFHEQKFRLRKCGLANVIYMVENYGSNKNVGLPIQSLMQALANTRVQDGFKVHFTDSLTNSARFLAMMTKRLTIEFKDKDLKGHNQEATQEELMTFNFFNKSSSKSKPLTVKETFIKLLLQLKGVSVEKALAITSMYSTPSLLMKAYSDCSGKEGEMLLSNLKYEDTTRNVGPKTSKSIYQLFTHRSLS